METTPAIDKAVDFFDAHTVELYPDVRDRVAHTIIDICSGDGSTVRFYNAAGEEFMKARTDRVSKQFQPLFDEKLMGVRHAENGGLYAIIENTDDDADEGDKTRGCPSVRRRAGGPGLRVRASYHRGGCGVWPRSGDGEPDGAVRRDGYGD